VIATTVAVQLKFTGGPTEPFAEVLQGEQVDRGHELKTHSTFCPLGPFDVVETVREPSGLVVAGVAHLEPLWTVEATLHLPRGTTFGRAPTEEHPAMRAVAECEEDWRRAAWVTRTTAFTFRVSSASRGWLEDNVEAHPYVEHIDLIRMPTMRADLAQWLAHPDF
jgi:hypothetical protein